MTRQSQKIILTALRDYKHDNLMKALSAISEWTPAEPCRQVVGQFQAHMRINEAVDRALQEMAVAR